MEKIQENMCFGVFSYISFTKISEREVRIATRNVEKCNY